VTVAVVRARRRRLLTPAVVIALVLAGCGAAGDASRPAAAPDAPQDGSFPLLDVTSTEVIGVRVTEGDRVSDLTRAGGASWVPAEGTDPAAATALALTIDDLFPLLGYRRLDVPADPAFGFDAAAATLTVRLRDGRSTTVVVGATSFSGAGSYAAVDTTKGPFFIVPTATTTALRMIAGEAVNAEPFQTSLNRAVDADLLANTLAPNPWLRQVLETSEPSTVAGS
jgi:hypothetical protein